MKLELETKPFSCLKRVLNETRMVEETTDVIIPDSCPDAEDVLFCDGLVFLRNKDLSEGCLSLSLGVSATGMIRPEGREEPEVLEAYIPISLRLENSAWKAGQQTPVEVQLNRLDCHLVNPRKVMFRASVTVHAACFEENKAEIVCACPEETVQVLQETVPLCCLSMMGEKSYTVEDIIGLPDEDQGKAICALQVQIRHSESRLSGSRAVFRGEAEVRMLYLTMAGALRTQMQNLPFVQYIDLGDCQEEDRLELCSMVTGCDADISGLGDRVNISLAIQSRAMVYSRREVHYLKDLYSTTGDVEAQREPLCYSSLLDTQYFNPMAQAKLEGDLLFSRVSISEPQIQRSGQQVEMTVPLSVHCLVRNVEGQLAGETVKAELKSRTQAAENCVTALEPGNTDVTAVGNSLRISGIVKAVTSADTCFDMVTEAELTPMEEKGKGPGLIIRHADERHSLWELAKEYRTTVEAIASANHLEGDVLPGQLLLIPGCSFGSKGRTGVIESDR
ncbi:MAG: DUF3794 domain-containing protein [Oscillospiraceae bacterium]|nr:DUF3794 domain-containing protein [Oscillospiraceae bacterium]